MNNKPQSINRYIVDVVFPIFRPILRQYLMDGDFFTGAALSTSLTKLALRYISLTEDVTKQNVRNVIMIMK